MEAYQLETALVEQRNNLHQIRDYVEEETLNDQLHEVEENLFRMLLTYGQSLLKEVIARHGDGRSESPVINTKAKVLNHHGKKISRIPFHFWTTQNLSRLLLGKG